MEKEIEAIIEEEFQKLPRKLDILRESAKRKKELEKRLMGNQIEEETLGAEYDKIMQDKIVKEHFLEELNKKMLNEAKLHEETEKKLFGMTYRIMKASHWSHQKGLILLEKK